MILELFKWLGALPMSKVISDSTWMYALIQALHLVALSAFLGAVGVVDLRLLGWGFNQQSVAKVARDAQPWLIAGFLGLLATGLPQLISAPLKEYNSPYFWIKMETLLVAVIFTLTLRRWVTKAEEGRVGPFWAKLVGIVSMLLWVAVAVPARLIGLF